MAAAETADTPEGDQSEPARELPDSAPDERDEDAGELSLDVIFEVLKNQRRRYVLRRLEQREETVSLGNLAEHVAAKENDKSVDAITSDERKRVYVGLYQCHLPKMDDMGIVDFNRDRGRVTLTDTASQLDEYLDTEAETDERPWHRYYGAASVVGLVLVAGVGAGVPLLAATPAITLGGVILAFAALSVLHATRVESAEE